MYVYDEENGVESGHGMRFGQCCCVMCRFIFRFHFMNEINKFRIKNGRAVMIVELSQCK